MGYLSRIALDGRVSGAGGFLVRLGPQPTLLNKKRESRNNVVGGVVVREASPVVLNIIRDVFTAFSR
jgi:hypothetical protein